MFEREEMSIMKLLRCHMWWWYCYQLQSIK